MTTSLEQLRETQRKGRQCTLGILTENVFVCMFVTEEILYSITAVSDQNTILLIIDYGKELSLQPINANSTNEYGFLHYEKRLTK